MSSKRSLPPSLGILGLVALNAIMACTAGSTVGDEGESTAAQSTRDGGLEAGSSLDGSVDGSVDPPALDASTGDAGPAQLTIGGQRCLVQNRSFYAFGPVDGKTWSLSLDAKCGALGSLWLNMTGSHARAYPQDATLSNQVRVEMSIVDGGPDGGASYDADADEGSLTILEGPTMQNGYLPVRAEADVVGPGGTFHVTIDE